VADDPLEREADRIADAVIAGAPIGTVGSGAPDTAQRKCAECEAEEEESLRRKPNGADVPAATGHSAAAAAAGAVSRGGQPLSPRERAYFQPRFGHDLSGIRIHTHDEAAAAARAIDARAYALGSDIAFARGEYRPDTGAGRHLMAHELAHVLQQDGDATPSIRRATYGTGTPPVFRGSTWAVVPQQERAHVDKAMALIDAVVADSRTYSECHDQYADRCPGGSASTLATIWNRARIWRVTSPDPDTYARAPTGGSDIGYTPLGYGQSPMDLATTLMHEAGHNCGIPGGDTHWHAELVSNYCMGPGQNAISISAGPGLSGADPLLLFSYRRFLGDWAGGRLRATLGVDLNAMALFSETDVPPRAGEFGSTMVGLQARLGGWGGTRYGGFSFRAETGFGVGRFNLRPATPGEEPTTSVRPDWILQVGPRAEFLIKFGDAEVLPVSVGAALRLAVPLNGEAEALQGALFSLEFRR
jgi:hypothetical protein